MTCSGDQKVTTMLLKVDLNCYQCYKKVKKLLCQFHQVQNQVFDEKNNVVLITVVCCSPEKIRDKLCRKGGKSIKSIEIKVDKPKPVSAPGPAQPDKPKPASVEPDKKPTPPEKNPKSDPKSSDSKSSSKKQDQAPAQAQAEDAAPKSSAPKPAPPAKQQEPVAQWVPGYPSGPPPQMLPVAVYSASPCYGPGPAYGYHYGHPYQPPYYSNSQCNYYSSEEDPAECSIM